MCVAKSFNCLATLFHRFVKCFASLFHNFAKIFVLLVSRKQGYETNGTIHGTAARFVCIAVSLNIKEPFCQNPHVKSTAAFLFCYRLANCPVFLYFEKCFVKRSRNFSENVSQTGVKQVKFRVIAAHFASFAVLRNSMKPFRQNPVIGTWKKIINLFEIFSYLSF
jgi:hypothetical protein